MLRAKKWTDERTNERIQDKQKIPPISEWWEQTIRIKYLDAKLKSNWWGPLNYVYQLDYRNEYHIVIICWGSKCWALYTKEQ